MSFNRRGGYDRRPDRRDRPDRGDRPPRREGGGDWQPRDRGPGGDRPPYGQRGGGGPGGGGRSFGGPRRDFDRRPDEGAMAIRLDPRRLGHLKQLAGDAGLRPGDLVRQWVEERIDAERGGAAPAIGSADLVERVDELTARIAALELAAGFAVQPTEPIADGPEAAPEAAPAEEASTEAAQEQPAAAPAPRARARRVSAAPKERVALHDEMIAVIRERGPQTAAELAAAIAERGRYAPPRSGKPLDAAMVSQRVSNPTYRSRFVRDEGRIGLAEDASA